MDRESHFVPCISASGHLLVERRPSLKQHGIIEDRDAACRSQFIPTPGKLPQVEAQQVNLDDIARHTRDRHAVAHLNSVPTYDEKVSCHGEQNRLQSNRETSKDEACDRGKGIELRYTAEENNERAEATDNNPAGCHKLSSTPDIMDPANREAFPDLSENQQ